jgi:ribosomal protein S18 acetylase RimI-like enzyme
VAKGAIEMSTVNITITQLSPDEWQKYRDIRLLALKSDPHAFGSSYEEEINLIETDWRNRISVMWFAIVDGQVAGLIGLLRRENQASIHCGSIISLWVEPAFRGHGVAQSLLQHVQDIASGLGLRKISLQVTISQAAAIKLYERMGFEKIGLLKENLQKDGVYLDEFFMEWHVASH